MPWSVVIVLSVMFIFYQTVNGRCSGETDTVRITYTGNMGVLISTDKTAVWIDGVHKFYKPEFQPTDPKFINEAKQHNGSFRSLQWLLFSHYHRDHFDASLTKEILAIDPDIKVSGATQVIDSIASAHSVNAWNRNGKLTVEAGEAAAIEAYNLQHTWPDRHSSVQNIMFSVIVDGKRITHLGDAGSSDMAYMQSAFTDADILVVPYWLLLNEQGRSLLKISSAKKIIATHIEPASKPDISLKNGDQQQVILFEIPGEFIDLM